MHHEKFENSTKLMLDPWPICTIKTSIKSINQCGVQTEFSLELVLVIVTTHEANNTWSELILIEICRLLTLCRIQPPVTDPNHITSSVFRSIGDVLMCTDVSDDTEILRVTIINV